MSGGHPEWPLDRKVYVGGLPNRVERNEIEDAFAKFGQLESVWVARNPPGFAFILFEDHRDARDAVRALDGSRMCGVRVRVEMSSGERRNKRGGGGYRGDGGSRYDDRNDDRGRDRDRNGSRPSARKRSRSRSGSRSRSRDRERDRNRNRSRSRSATPKKGGTERSRSAS